MNAILKTEKLCKSFSNEGNMQHVIKNMDLTIMEGDFTVSMGASGSGKSTLWYALAGMDKPTLGKVFFGGRCTIFRMPILPVGMLALDGRIFRRLTGRMSGKM